MLITDAINEIADKQPEIYTKYICTVEGTKVTLEGEFGPMVRYFTDNDPDLDWKVRRFYGDFLRFMSDNYMERLMKRD